MRPKAITDRFPWAIARMRAGHAVVIPRVDALPREAAVDVASYRRAGVRSSLIMPMRVGTRIEGALAFGCLKREQHWPDAVVEGIRVLATIFGNALAHKGAQESLDAAMRFERGVSGVLAALLKARRSEHDSVIDAGLRDLAQVFGQSARRSGSGSATRSNSRRRTGGSPRASCRRRTPSARWRCHGSARNSCRVRSCRFARHADLPPRCSRRPGHLAEARRASRGNRAARDVGHRRRRTLVRNCAGRSRVVRGPDSTRTARRRSLRERARARRSGAPRARGGSTGRARRPSRHDGRVRCIARARNHATHRCRTGQCGNRHRPARPTDRSTSTSCGLPPPTWLPTIGGERGFGGNRKQYQDRNDGVYFHGGLHELRNAMPCFSRYAFAIVAVSSAVIGMRGPPSSSTMSMPAMGRPSIMSRIAGMLTLPCPSGQ